MHESSFFSTSSPTLVSCAVDFSHSEQCEVISHCSFDLHFPDDKCCWASFDVSVGHLYVFFGEMFVHVFYPFLKWIICFLGVKLYKVFIYFGYYPFTGYVICKYLLPFSRLPFSFVDCVLCCAEAFFFLSNLYTQCGLKLTTLRSRVTCSTN